jgi:type I restriction enzyme R subunit
MTVDRTPEQKAEQKIESKLEEQGWEKVDSDSNRTGYDKYVQLPDGREADYVLYHTGSPVAIIEAKKHSINPENKRDQARTYAKNIDESKDYRNTYSVPFTYTTNGEKIVFEDLREDTPQFREVYTFHTAQNLDNLLDKQYSEVMDKMEHMESEDIDKGLWDNQSEGFDRGTKLIAEGKNKILYTMATGSGKTRLGIALSYAFLETGLADRILFAVDTDQLRTDTRKDYKNYEPVGSPPFSQNYLTGNLDEDEIHSRDVVVTTTQKLSRRLHEEQHSFSVGEFDVVIADEAHRGVFNEDGHGIALDYFDALEIGLTATPHEKTLERYNYNEAYSYDYNDALKHHHVAPFKSYSVNTQIMTEKGFRHNGKWYSPNQIGEDIIIRDSQEKVAESLLENTRVKDELTLFFAQNTTHARVIVDDLREIYGDLFENPYEEIKRVTGDDFQPHVTLSEFKQPYRPPHIIVTVDMVTTGIDIRPLNNIVLMRPVKSKVLFNQMMGRGTRTHETKDHFKIFDCVKAFEYHDGVPPFATKEVEYNITDSGESSVAEPEEEPEIIDKPDVDKVIKNCRVYPSQNNEWVERDDFVREIQSVIKNNDEVISKRVADCTSVKEADTDIESILLDEWKHYQKETILDAFEGLETLYLLCVRTIEGYEELRGKARYAKKETVSQHELTGKQVRLIQDVSDRAVTERSNISKNNFYQPPLSYNWGVDTAEELIENLDDVLNTFNRNFLYIEVE